MWMRGDRKRNAMFEALRQRYPQAPVAEVVNLVLEVDRTTACFHGSEVALALPVVTGTVRWVAATLGWGWVSSDSDRVETANLLWQAWHATATDPLAGVMIESGVLKPWVRGCWDDDGWPAEHHDTESSLAPCAYHDQWLRIAGSNAMTAWVEPTEGGFAAVVWDPDTEDFIELPEGDAGFETEAEARAAADTVLAHQARKL